MQEIRPNSLTKREENKESDKPVESKSKELDDFAGHVVNDIIADGLKDLAITSLSSILSATGDLLKNLLTDALWPEGRKTAKKDTKTGYTSYSYRSGRPVESGRSSYASSEPASTQWMCDIVDFETSAMAKAFVDDLKSVLTVYKKLHLTDIYDIAGITTENYQLDKLGWTSIDGIQVVFNRETHRYSLVFPRGPEEFR